MDKIVLLILLAIFPLETSESTFDRWIVWNVGQGEWVTHVLSDRCLHFDMGGEHWPRAAIKLTCGDKLNFAYFSHWDMDHIGFAQKARSVLPHLCLGKPPLGPTSKKKQHLFDDWPVCNSKSDLKIWQPPLTRGKKRSSNEQSQIYLDHSMLVTGDAPQEEERLFTLDDHLDNLKNVHWLVLGHHGSRTSTSELLLQSLPNLRLSIASARHAKYGHPHEEVLRRLQFYRVPVLSTEDWGSIEIRE